MVEKYKIELTEDEFVQVYVALANRRIKLTKMINDFGPDEAGIIHTIRDEWSICGNVKDYMMRIKLGKDK